MQKTWTPIPGVTLLTILDEEYWPNSFTFNYQTLSYPVP